MTKRGGRLPQITSTKNVAALCQPDGSVGSAAFSEFGSRRYYILPFWLSEGKAAGLGHLDPC